MKKRSYPTSLFVFGFILGFLLRRFYLWLIGIILIIIGKNNDICYYLGCISILVNLIWSFIEQIALRNAILKHTDNPNIIEFQDALSDDENWKENIIDIVESKIEEYEDEDLD